MNKEINILVVEPGKAPYPASVEGTLEAFSKIVGGPIEVGCSLPHRAMLICNSEGKNLGLPPNRAHPKGSIPMYREFGLERDFLDMPGPAAETRMLAPVREAVELWEPRATVKDVKFVRSSDGSGRLIARVEIEINGQG